MQFVKNEILQRTRKPKNGTTPTQPEPLNLANSKIRRSNKNVVLNLPGERSGQIDESSEDMLLADREQHERADRGLRHVQGGSGGAAAHPHQAPERPAPGGEARGPPDGAAVREGVREGRRRYSDGGHSVRKG